MPILPPPGGFGAIFDFQDVQKGTIWAPFSRTNPTFSLTPSSGRRPGTVLGATRDPKMVPRRFEARFSSILDRFTEDFGPI